MTNPIKKTINKLLRDTYISNTNLPNTSNWNGTLWELDLQDACTHNYSYIITNDHTWYRIKSKDQVNNEPVLTKFLRYYIDNEDESNG